MTLLSLLPETLNTPEILAVVTLLVAVGIHYQKGLTYREYRSIHRFIERVFPVCQRITAPDSRLSNALEKSSVPIIRFIAKTDFRSFIHDKGGRDDPEFVAVAGNLRELWTAGRKAGAIPHLIKSVKRREMPDGAVQLSKLHLLWVHDDGKQTEVYAFRNRDGTIDLYAHLETAVTDAEGHLSDGIEPGDVRGVLADVSL